MNKHLSNAIYKIIKSLIGLLFRHGISFGEFSQLAKRAYIEVTEEELLASGQKASTSMISISTGLTRKDVAALRKNPLPAIEQSTQQNRAIRVMSAWVSDPEFCSKTGEPLVLPVNGDTASFEKLVSAYSGDMPYRAMLKELLRIDAVEQIGNDEIKLIQMAYLASDDDNEKYDFLGEDVAALIATIKHNIIAEDEPFYQRKVSYNQIPIEQVAAFKALANKENQKLLLTLNAWLARHDQYQSVDQQAVQTVGVGVYYFEKTKKGENHANPDNDL